MMLLIGSVWVSCTENDKMNHFSLQERQAALADSLVYGTLNSDPYRAIAIVDSLKDAYTITEAKANYYRAYIYHQMKQDLTAELCYQQALGGNELYNERPAYFYYAYDQLATILACKGDHEGALEAAMNGYSVARSGDDNESKRWAATLLHDIGYCQMLLGRVDEAERTFDRAYSALKSLVEQDSNYDNLYSWARVGYNIVDSYTSTQQYQKVDAWMERAEEAVNRMVNSPECSAQEKEEYIGGLKTHKAIMLIKTGHRTEAEEAFRQIINSDYAETNLGLIDRAEYLRHAERWGELADFMPRIDSLANAWQVPLSLYYLKEYLVPDFIAYMKSGRYEKALQTAERLATSIDSVEIYEREHNAAELAIIYETKEKEAKIAEQQNSMKMIGWVAIAVVLTLLVIFLTIYLILRYRAARQLKVKNRKLEWKNAQLKIANARAEESSRMKTDFIQQISHEIRTPLNILSGFTQILTTPEMEMDSTEKEEIGTHIAENVDRITGLVNKMLELADASSQTVVDCTDRISMVQIAEMAITDSNIQRAEHLDFTLLKEECIEDVEIITNQRYAIRALSLLLDNAQKFTRRAESYNARLHEGRKEMVVLKVGMRGKKAYFMVEDTGIGVPIEEAEHIFDKFVQLDEYYNGTGIGLTVARSIARRMGGDIVLDTTYTGGARFIFSLPLPNIKTNPKQS